MKYWHLSLIDLDMAIEADYYNLIDGSVEFRKDNEDATYTIVGLFAQGYWVSVVELDRDMFDEMIKDQVDAKKGVH